MAFTIGTLVSALPAVSHGALHYRALEHAKNAALQSQNGNFNKKMSIPPDAICDILWWEQNITGSFSPIQRDHVHLTLYSDASLEGWGGTDEVTHVGGRWTEYELPGHKCLRIAGSIFNPPSIRFVAHQCTYTAHVGQHNCRHVP